MVLLIICCIGIQAYPVHQILVIIGCIRKRLTKNVNGFFNEYLIYLFIIFYIIFRHRVYGVGVAIYIIIGIPLAFILVACQYFVCPAITAGGCQGFIYIIICKWAAGNFIV